MKRRWLQILLHVFLAIVIALALLAVLTQTAPFRNWLQQFIVNEANRNLNGTLHIEQLQGNLLTRLQLRGVLLTRADASDTVLYVPELDLQYSPLRLLQRRIAIDSIRIDSLQLRLRQMPDSTWNLAALLRGDSTTVPDTTAKTESRGFPFTVTVGELRLRNARLQLAALDATWPRQIHDLNLRLGGKISQARQSVRITEFRLRAEKPGFILQQLTFDLEHDRRETRLRNFILRSARSDITAHALYAGGSAPQASGRVEARPLAFPEFKIFLPALDLPASPDLTLRLRLRNDVLRAQIDVQDGEQQLHLQGDIARFSAILNPASKPAPHYTVLGKMQDVRLNRWLGLPETDYRLTGRFRLQGTGFKPEDTEATLQVEFANSIFYRQPVDSLQVQAQYNRGALTTTLRGLSALVNLNAEAEVQDVFDEPQYTLRAWLKNLDMAQLFDDRSLTSDLDLYLLAHGLGFDPQKMQGDMRLDMLPVSFLHTRIDTLHFATLFDAGKARGLALHLAAAPLRLDLTGSADLDRTVDMRYRMQIRDLAGLQTFLGADTLHAAGGIAGHIRGKPDSLQFTGVLQMRDLLYGSHAADSLAAQVRATLRPDGPAGTGTAFLAGVHSSKMALDSVTLKSDFHPGHANFSLDATREAFSAHLRAESSLDSTLKIILPEIAVAFKDQRWKGGRPDMWVEIDSSSLRVHDFRLTAVNDTSSHPAQLYVHGVVSPGSAENLQVRLSQLDLQLISTLLQTPVRLGGLFSMDVHVEGQAQHPVIRSQATITGGRINDFLFGRFSGALRYDRGTVFLNYALIPGHSDSLTIHGTIPMPLFAADSSMAGQDMQVKIKADAMPLNLLLTSVPDIREVHGTFSCDLDLRNRLANPRPYGFLRIDRGAFKIPDLGVDYSDLQVHLTADSSRLNLEKLEAHRGPGYVRATGYVDLDSSMASGVVHSLEVDLVADQFYLAQHKDFEIEIGAETFLRGDSGAPQFGGEVKVTHAIFDIPAMLKRTEKHQDSGEYAVPMLVRAARQVDPKRWGGLPEAEAGPDTSGITTPAPPSFMKNLHGTLKLTIPRDTWLQAQNMRIEIEGDLDLVKKAEDFELFGSIAVVRGFYSLYGRQFKVVEGQLTFQGGDELNPGIMLEAKYKFRDAAKERRTLLLHVNGDLLQPKIKFTLDEKDIDESDAVAYIVFGRSMDELSYGEKSDVAQSGAATTVSNQVLMDVASSLVTSQLASSLGQEFKLDLIEVRAQDNWQSATFVIGKYITNELFVSYQRTFGESEKNDIAPQTIVVEYELTRHLFLQASEGDSKTSGADVILKFQKE